MSSSGKFRGILPPVTLITITSFTNRCARVNQCPKTLVTVSCFCENATSKDGSRRLVWDFDGIDGYDGGGQGGGDVDITRSIPSGNRQLKIFCVGFCQMTLVRDWKFYFGGLIVMYRLVCPIKTKHKVQKGRLSFLENDRCKHHSGTCLDLAYCRWATRGSRLDQLRLCDSSIWTSALCRWLFGIATHQDGGERRACAIRGLIILSSCDALWLIGLKFEQICERVSFLQSSFAQ